VTSTDDLTTAATGDGSPTGRPWGVSSGSVVDPDGSGADASGFHGDPGTGSSTPGPSGESWVISSGGHEATVVEVGGGLRSYTVDGVDLVDGYPADELPKGCRGQVLAPFANRIRDGLYSFEGVQHQLDIGEVATHTAFHGLVRWQSWQVEVLEPDSVTLTTTVQARDGYPFTVRLGVRYSVGPGGLTVEHTATNRGSTSAPFMMATHCYPTVSGTVVDELRLTVPAATFVPTDDRLLPLPSEPVDGTPYDFRHGPVFGDRVVDNAYGDLSRDPDGRVRVTVTAPDGHGFQVWAGDTFPWLQVYSSDTMTQERFRRSFAIEPMTAPPDAFRSEIDLVVLRPGRRWEGRWGITPVSAGEHPSTGEFDRDAQGPARGTGPAIGGGETVSSPPVTGTAADLLPDSPTEETATRRADVAPADPASREDDERILREVPPHHLG